MAVLKTANTTGKYQDDWARIDVISYVLDPRKSPHGYRFGLGVDMSSPYAAAESMQQVAAMHGKDSGVRLHHFLIGFKRGEIRSLKKLAGIAWEITCLLGENYQVVSAVHEDNVNPNIHVVINSVGFATGERYRGTRNEFFLFKNAVANMLLSYGVTELEYRPAKSFDFF